MVTWTSHGLICQLIMYLSLDLGHFCGTHLNTHILSVLSPDYYPHPAYNNSSVEVEGKWILSMRRKSPLKAEVESSMMESLNRAGTRREGISKARRLKYSELEASWKGNQESLLMMASVVVTKNESSAIL